ncbi:hypothetical protein [Laribacter hongkongensis]|nr:hypothetical protein [Laribacter hongkongensis]
MNEFTDLVRKWMSDISGLAIVSTFGFYIAYKKSLGFITWIAITMVFIFSLLIVARQIGELIDFRKKHKSMVVYQLLAVFGLLAIYIFMIAQFGFAMMTLQQITG